jgi:HEPN domain-containing protein
MKTDIDVARGWLCKAESDLKTVDLLVDAGGPLDTACFHAQQAVEKCLKAVLCAHGVVPPRTHDIGDLTAHAVYTLALAAIGKS